MYKKYGRKSPYTEIGIAKLPCFRCGKKANQQWQICADNNLYRPVCLKCDIALNKMVLKWMGFEDWKEKIEKYKQQYE